MIFIKNVIQKKYISIGFKLLTVIELVQQLINFIFVNFEIVFEIA